MITPKQNVNIKTSLGNIPGIALKPVVMNEKSYWWVQYTPLGSSYVDCNLFLEEDLVSWLNTKKKSCTCGSWSVKHPAHSKWCDAE